MLYMGAYIFSYGMSIFLKYDEINAVRFIFQQCCLWASLVAQLVKNPPAMKETWVRSLGWEYTLERGTAIYFSILAWRIPWTVYSPRGRKELDTTGVQSVKNLPAMQETACNAGDPVLILGLGRSPAEGIPTPVFLPGKVRGQRSLVDYSPWGCKIQTQLSN